MRLSLRVSPLAIFIPLDEDSLNSLIGLRLEGLYVWNAYDLSKVNAQGNTRKILNKQELQGPDTGATGSEKTHVAPS